MVLSLQQYHLSLRGIEPVQCSGHHLPSSHVVTHSRELILCAKPPLLLGCWVAKGCRVQLILESHQLGVLQNIKSASCCKTTLQSRHGTGCELLAQHA